MTEQTSPANQTEVIEVKVTASVVQASVIDNNEVPDALYEAIENLNMTVGSGNKTITLIIENDLEADDEVEIEEEDDDNEIEGS